MKNQQHTVLDSDVKKCTCNPDAPSNAEADCCGDKATKDHVIKASKSSSSCCGGGQAGNG